MATITKVPDGDLSLGNLRGELITLQPAVSDYVPGGYLIQGIGGATENTGNVGLDKVLIVEPAGGQGGLTPVWNPLTSKMQIFGGGIAPGTPIGLGPVSTGVSTTVGIVGANNGVLAVTQPNTLKAGQLVLYKSTGAGAAISGQIVVVASATATAWTANVGLAAAITAATADVTITYQVVQDGNGNAVTLGTALNVTTSLASATLLTLTVAAPLILPGSFIYIQGSTGATNSNGAIVQVLTNSGTQITANWTGSTAGGTGGAETTMTIQPLLTAGSSPVVTANASQVFNSLATASSAGTAGVITLGTYNSLAPGNIVVAQGLVNGAAVNGDLLVVNQASLTAKQFVANHQTAAFTSGADTGVVSVLVTGVPPVSGVASDEVGSGTDLSAYTFQLLCIGL